MEILKRVPVPTGDICIVRGAKGPLEMLSVGDYGKDVNLKADFLGLNIAPEPVRHQAMLPLEEKWVVTISTQYGCSMGCTFCDVPMVGRGRNATLIDMQQQVLTALTQLHPEVRATKRLNVHFARMGEPTWNPAVLDAARWLKYHVDPEYTCHPVVSTMMPRRNEWLRTFIHSWMRIKNRLYHGDAGLQISINSTDEAERSAMFNRNAYSLMEIASVMGGTIPVGRKIALNFALADYIIDPDVLLRYFSPELYVVKLTPMHKTVRAQNRELMTAGDYTTYEPYAHHEEQLRVAGYDVIVFIASKEEDESRITCGNAILADTSSGEEPESG